MFAGLKSLIENTIETKKVQKSIEELMQNSNKNNVSDEAQTPSKYVVKFDMEPERKSDEYIEKYRNALLSE